jgi:uncharacterized protein
MNLLPVTLLVVAKAPEPGRAKTRLAVTVGDRVAAEIAAAALLDTLDAVDAAPVAARVVALTGNLDEAAGAADIRRRLESFTVIGQRGDDFGDRLANAQAVLGLACDGGWWVLGLQTPAAAECLRSVPMSQPDTGELTLKALHANGIDVASVERLTDVDFIDDIAAVRDACDPASRFARVTRAAGL